MYGELGLGDSDFFEGTNRNAPARVGTASDWKAVSGGHHYTLALKADGSLWAWGFNLGDTNNRSTPTRVGTAGDWKEVLAGDGHTLAIKTDGSLWAWGSNLWGALGLRGYDLLSSPTRVDTAGDWMAVSTGLHYTLALKTDGSLWAWGFNWYGQLGLGYSTDWNAPTRVGTAGDWKTVSAGQYHTLAIKTDGSLWAWGRNKYGVLGIGLGGDIFEDTNQNAPTRVGTASDWKEVLAGTNHTVAIKNDGSLWAWGGNYHGQLGIGNTIGKVVPTLVVGAATDQMAAGCQ